MITIKRVVKWSMVLFFLINFILNVVFNSDRIDLYHNQLLASSVGYTYRIPELIQYPSVSLGISLIEQSEERNLYINPDFSSINKLVDSIEVNLKPSNKSQSAWGVKINSDKKLYVSGWAVFKGIDSKKTEIFFVLKNTEMSYLFSCLPFNREDVTEAFKDGVNYNHSGFGFLALKDDIPIPSGEYELGIAIREIGSTDLYYDTKGVMISTLISEEGIKSMDISSLEQLSITAAFGVKHNKKVTTIDGWAFLSAQPALRTQKKVLLKPENSSMAYVFTPKVVFRDDVTRHFNDGNNYDFSGFEYSFQPDLLDLPNGVYEVGLMLSTATESSYIFNGVIISIP